MGLSTAQGRRKRRYDSTENLAKAKLLSSKSDRTKGETGRVNVREVSDIRP